MKNQYRPKDAEYENEQHISRKKKAVAKKLVKRSVNDRINEFGLEDEKEIIEYERYVR
jgi:hypothetical protein